MLPDKLCYICGCCPLVSAGVRSEKELGVARFLDDSTDRLDSGNGKTESNYVQPRDSACRDNWVSPAALYTGCIMKRASEFRLTRLIPAHVTRGAGGINRHMSGRKFRLELVHLGHTLKQTSPQYWCKPLRNSSTTPIICWLAAATTGRLNVTVNNSPEPDKVMFRASFYILFETVSQKK